MEKVFKGTRLIYRIVTFLGILLCTFWGYPEKGLAMTLVQGLIWVLVSWIGFVLALSFQDSRKRQLLMDCKSSAYIDYAQQVLQHVKARDYRNMTMINLYAAYQDLGMGDKAEACLWQVDTDFPDTLRGLALSHSYHYNLSDYYYRQGDLERAEQELVFADSLLSSDKLKPAMREKVAFSSQSQRWEWRVLRGELEGAESYYIQLFQMEKNLRDRVYAQWMLAEIYRSQGQLAKALEACEYVVSHGGETQYVAKAKKIVEQINWK